MLKKTRLLNGQFIHAFVLFISAVSIAAGCQNITEKDADPVSSPGRTAVSHKSVAVYFAEDVSLEWNTASANAVMLRNLLGHFAVSVDIRRVKDYRQGDLDRYDIGIYFSSIYDYPIPSTFLRDIYHNTSRPFFWIGDNIMSLLALDDQGKLGFRFVSRGKHPFPATLYQETRLERDEQDVFHSEVELLDNSICEVKAELTDDTIKAPDLIRCGNFWYMTNNPFLFNKTNVFLVADVLHDLLNTDVKPSRRALVRLDDISSVDIDQLVLRDIADRLYDKNIPFAVGVIPKYVPSNDGSTVNDAVVEMGETKSFIDTLKYLESKGGTLIQHGCTHQYDGLSGVDFEFWNENANKPIPEDSYEWAVKRIDGGRNIFREAIGHDPLLWETPHYAASPIDYFAIASRFDMVFESLRVYNTTATTYDAVGDYVGIGYSTEQKFPYVVYDTQYGFGVLPENLGYIDVGRFDDYGIPLEAEGKIYRARQLKIVRDGVVGFFFHTWQPIEQLLETIRLIEKEGYRFVDVRSLIDEGPPPYIDLPIESNAEAAGDDGNPPAVKCSEDAEVCSKGLGCHEGLCGICTSADECRSYDGCRANGTCGECELTEECRKDEACRHGFCMPQVIPSIDIGIDPSAFADLTADDEDAFSDEFFPCTLKAEGMSYEGCEIRLLGNSARLFPKKSFRVKFPEDAVHPGYSRKINLKADWNDPAAMRSFLSYETIRRLTGIPTPRVRYRRVYINGTYYGLYTEIERIGSKFLKVRNRNKETSLYEGDGVFPSGALVPMPDKETYMSVFNKRNGDETDYSDIINLIENVFWTDYENSPGRAQTVTTLTDEVVHTDEYLKYLAAMVAIQNKDNVTNNFLLGIQKIGNKTAWEFFPWDMDISFGCQWDTIAGGAVCGCHPFTPSSDPFVDPVCDNSTLNHTEWSLAGIITELDPEPVYPTSVWFNMLTHLLLNSPNHRPVFNQYVCDYLSSIYWNERLPKLVDAVSETIENAVIEDTNDLSNTKEEFDRAVQGIKDFIVNRPTYTLTTEGEISCL